MVSWKDQKERSAILFLLCWCVLVIVLLVLSGLRARNQLELDRAIANNKQIGQVTTVSAQSGMLFERSRTFVGTTQGFFVVQGNVEFEKGTSLVLQTRKSADRWICDTTTGKCFRAIGRDD